jgi:hypothetical protein
MKLIIFCTGETPFEFEVADYKAVERKCRNTRGLSGDAKWVTFKEDGTVKSCGQVDEMGGVKA